MPIPSKLAYAGETPEFQFRDEFVMPLLVRLGFGIVANYHGQREYGRDLIFGDLDRFGHIVYYGMQLKYAPSLSLRDSHDLVHDAEQATHNPFTHPHSGREEFISTFYVANAGSFSDQARENFFNVASRRGVRDAKLLDGNALVLLDEAASLNRTANLKERLTGLLQEVRRNHATIGELLVMLPKYVADTNNASYPMQRCRNTACANYLNAPFAIIGVPVETVDRYWELIGVLNSIADSVGVSIAGGGFREGRVKGFKSIAPECLSLGARIADAVSAVLLQMST